VRSKLTSVRLTQRAHIVLLAADGLQNKEIAERLAVGRVQVSRWRDRYAEPRLAGIEQDLPRGAPPVKVDVARVGRADDPEQARSRYALEHAQDGSGAGRERSQRLAAHWRANGLKPHLVHGFKVSRDLLFVEKSKTS